LVSDVYKGTLLNRQRAR